MNALTAATDHAHILIVKLSSLGDVVHSMPVVHDILAAHPHSAIDWVVEPGFAPVLRRVDGLHRVIECPLRRWSKRWWTAPVRAEWRAFRQQLQSQPYDAVIDLQGLTKSVVIARLATLSPTGATYGLANRTDGASFEAPARWLVDHAISITPHIHALDRSRELVAQALRYPMHGSPTFGLQARGEAAVAPALAHTSAPTLVFVHGTSRDDKLWPEAAWIALGQRAIAHGWRIALPHHGSVELARAQRIQQSLGDAAEVWPEMGLDALVDRLGAAQGVVGVDSGLSHIAVALQLAHVQIYNFPTAWRTGPQAAHGHRHQESVEGQPTPSLDAVWAAWCRVAPALPGAVDMPGSLPVLELRS